jgi:hypothetical protein
MHKRGCQRQLCLLYEGRHSKRPKGPSSVARPKLPRIVAISLGLCLFCRVLGFLPLLLRLRHSLEHSQALEVWSEPIASFC